MRKQNTDLQRHGRAEQETSKLYICHGSTRDTLKEAVAHRNSSLLKCCTAEQNVICVLFVFHSPSDALPMPTEPRRAASEEPRQMGTNKSLEKRFGKQRYSGKAFTADCSVHYSC